MLYYLRLDPATLNGKTLLEGCDSCLVAANSDAEAYAAAVEAFPGTTVAMWEEEADVVEMGDNVVAANGGAIRFKSATLTPYPLEQSEG